MRDLLIQSLAPDAEFRLHDFGERGTSSPEIPIAHIMYSNGFGELPHAKENTMDEILQALVGKTVEAVTEHKDDSGVLRINIFTSDGKRLAITPYVPSDSDGNPVLLLRSKNVN